MATTVTYNSIVITKVQTRSWRSEMVFDQSGLIPFGIRQSFDFTGLVQSPVEDTWNTRRQDVQDAMTTPRKDLAIVMGTITVIDIKAAESNDLDADIANGPIPTNVEVTNIHGAKASFISATIEWTEPLSGVATPVVLSHRWEQTFEIDDKSYQTRTVLGEFRLTSRTAQLNPDTFRCHVLPIETAGYRRISLQFIVSSDGRTLTYRSVDREHFMVFPRGIMLAEGTCSINLVGATMKKTMQFRLEGEKFQIRENLILAAQDVLQRRINFQKDVIESITIIEDLFGSNSITVQCSAISTKELDTAIPFGSISLFTKVANDLGPFGDQGRFRPISAHGAGLVRAAFQVIFDQVTDGNPADQTAVVKADTETFDRGLLQDLDQDSVPETLCLVAEVEAAEAVDSLVDDSVRMTLTEADGVLSDEQLGARPFTSVQHTFDRIVENRYLTLKTADPNEPDQIQQISSPVVREKHTALFIRQGEPPVVTAPDLVKALTARQVVVKSFRTMPVIPMTAADGASIQYGVAFEWELEHTYVPTDLERWNPNSALAFGGASVNLIEWLGGQALAQPFNPQIDPTAPVEDTTVETESVRFV